MKLLAPNGEPSNLTPEQYELVRTPEFKAWFGDWEKLAFAKLKDAAIDEVTLNNLSKNVSKVVDENGEPMVMNHYSNYNFKNKEKQIFEENIFKQTIGNSVGFYFTKDELKTFSFKYQFFLNVKKLIKIPQNQFNETLIDDMVDILGKDLKADGLYDRLETYIETYMFFKDEIGINIKKLAKQKKINGFVFSEEQFPCESMGCPNIQTIVVFEPNQIKLADGTNTTFDSNNPDIRYADGGIINKKFYHSSDENLSLENILFYSDEGDYRGNSFYITDDINYSKNFGQNLYEITLSKFNDLKESKKNIKKISNYFNLDYEDFDTIMDVLQYINDNYEKEKVRISLVNLGFDGLIQKNKYYTQISLWNKKVIASFNPILFDKFELGGETVYHGSPYDFKEFTTSAIGTGEGASGWGYGLYFSEDKEEANDYACKLEKEEKEGRVYTAQIPDSEKYLDFHKEFQEQSDYVKKALVSMPKKYKIKLSEGEYEKQLNNINENIDEYDFKIGDDEYWELINYVLEPNVLFRRNYIYDWIKENLFDGYEYETSEFLYKLGIKGVKHNAFGFTNYIVFNEDDIKLLNKETANCNYKYGGKIEKISKYFKGGQLYHGSPYSFEEFTTEMMGAGQGSQSYGWGLYFTESTDIAKRYALTPSLHSFFINGKSLKEYDMPMEDKFVILNFWTSAWQMGYTEDKEKYIHEIMYELATRSIFLDEEDESVFDTETIIEHNKEVQNYKRIYDILNDSEVEIRPNLYAVTIHKNKTPENYDWLDWDKELSEENAKMIYSKLTPEIKRIWGLKSSPQSYGQGYGDYRDLSTYKGKNIYQALVRILDSEKEASLFLLQAGIDGIKYLSDSNYEDRVYNYVVFNDDDVVIESKEQFEVGGETEIEDKSEEEIQIDILHYDYEFSRNKALEKYKNGGDAKLLAPNGKPSNLNPEQYKLVRTPEFKAWFGDWENSPETASKVVDENGEPLVVYHGAEVRYNKRFYIFRKGSYFTDNFNSARYYSLKLAYGIEDVKEENTTIYECFLNIKKPKTFDYKNEDAEILFHDFDENDKRIKELEGNGYDGLIWEYDYVMYDYRSSMSETKWNDLVKTWENNPLKKKKDTDNFWNSSDGVKEKHFIIFNPNQIKLADGTNTTFDSKNNDIRYDNGGGVERLIYTPNFKKWFGNWQEAREEAIKNIVNNDYSIVLPYTSKGINKKFFSGVSKVMDKEPKIVWHGSNNDFNIFDNKSGLPYFYFSDKKNVAKLYGNIVKPYYLNIKNPILFYADCSTFNELGNKQSVVHKLMYALLDAKKFNTNQYVYYYETEYVVEPNNDGIIIKDIVDAEIEEKLEKLGDEIEKIDKLKKDYCSDVFIVINSNQIKLADGTNTTFDSNNPDIRYADGGIINKKFVIESKEQFEVGGETEEIDSEEKQIDSDKEIQIDILHYDYEHSRNKALENTTFDGNNPDNPDIRYEGGYVINRTYFDDGNKLVVYSTKDYKIAVDNVNNARYITLWFVNSLFDLDVKVGSLALDKTEDDFLKVQEINIQKSHRGKGMATKMYLMALKYSADNIKGIKSYLPNRANKRQIPKIYKALNGKVDGGDYAYIYKDDNLDKFELGGTTIRKSKSILLAPNGKPSNLTHEQYKLVRTPEFKAWFGDWENSPETSSKVVDENGEPLVCYHATDNEFNEFIYEKANKGSGAYKNIGFYFTAFKQYKSSSEYGKIIKKFFLNLRNPFITGVNIYEDYASKSLTKNQIIELIGNRNAVSNFYNKEEIIKRVTEKTKRIIDYITFYKSYSIENQLHWIWEAFFSNENIEVFQKEVIKATKYDGSFIINNDYFVAFKPEQIKLADGTNTTFDSNNPDIRYESGGELNTPNFEHTLKQLYPNIFYLEMESQHDLGSTFLKCQAFYEWDNFKGKNFSVKEFHEWYAKNLPHLKPYTQEYYGFNVPSKEIYECYKVNTERTIYDNFLLDIISEIENKYNTKEFYLIGAVKGNERTLNHELAHGFFWADKSYKQDMTKLVDEVHNKKELLRILKEERGYGEDVLIDEAQAFLSTGLIVEIADWENYRQPFIERFERQLNSYGAGGNIKLLAPNGEPSNLTPEQYELVRTPEFKAWFGDWENSPETSSKVVDENGEPLVCQHRTNEEFYVFDKSKSGKKTDVGYFGKGFYFSPKDKGSEIYGDKIIYCFLDVKKPIYKKSYELDSNNSKSAIILRGDFDFIMNRKLSIKESNEIQEIVVFEPNQIKLADGTNTTFDSNNPDIRFNDGGSVVVTKENQKEVVPTFVETDKIEGVFSLSYGDWNYYDNQMKVNGLLEHFKIPIRVVKYLGSGYYGYAYLTQNKTVLKITNNAEEAYSSFLIMQKAEKLKSQAEVYNVFKVTDGDKSLYFIEKEYVPQVLYDMKKDNEESYKYYADLLSEIRLKDEYRAYLEKLTDDKIKKAAKTYFLDYYKLPIDTPNSELNEQDYEVINNTIKILRFYKDLLNDIDLTGIDFADIQVKNVGFIDEKFVCFDCALGDVSAFNLGGKLEKV